MTPIEIWFFLAFPMKARESGVVLSNKPAKMRGSSLSETCNPGIFDLEIFQVEYNRKKVIITLGFIDLLFRLYSTWLQPGPVHERSPPETKVNLILVMEEDTLQKVFKTFQTEGDRILMKVDSFASRYFCISRNYYNTSLVL